MRELAKLTIVLAVLGWLIHSCEETAAMCIDEGDLMMYQLQEELF